MTRPFESNQAMALILTVFIAMAASDASAGGDYYAAVGGKAAEIAERIREKAAAIASAIKDRASEISEDIRARAAEIKADIESRTVESRQSIAQRTSEAGESMDRRAAESKTNIEARTVQSRQSIAERTRQVSELLKARAAESKADLEAQAEESRQSLAERKSEARESIEARAAESNADLEARAEVSRHSTEEHTSVARESVAADEATNRPIETAVWTKGPDGCYTATDNPELNRRAQALADTVLHRSDSSPGCITFPYMGAPYYDEVIRNKVHAGIDFRANENDEVFSAISGKVVEKSFNSSASSPRSTLILENSGGTMKILYLHMSQINVVEGQEVTKGQLLGKAGTIGTASPHLHLEAWSASSPIYQARSRAVSGSACRPLEDKTCEVEDIMALTTDPLLIIE